MKRIGNIFGQICTYGNLLDAFGKVQRGKGRRPDVLEWKAHLEERLNALLADLLNGDFRFGDYTVFKVFDPKERTIYAAAIRERIIHHAVINVCGEWLEKGVMDDSYACRKGKGQLRAVWRAQGWSRRHEWCLKLDIKSYFDSIDQGILMQLLKEKVKDCQVLCLFEKLLESYHTIPGKGLPIGNLTSQYFANLYLDAFDRWAGEASKRGYVRYMDDMLIFGEHDDLRQLQSDAAEFLQSRLQLTIKHGGSLQPCRQGVDFLGFRVFPHKILLNHRSKRRYVRRIRQLDELLENGSISEADYQARATALTAFIQHADTYNFRNRINNQHKVI